MEANSRAHSFTPHPCSEDDCDRNGCGLNPYASGYTDFYGPGLTVDTSKPFTVVTQFNTDDGTTTGTLTSITRRYLQDGVLIDTASPAGDAITTESCNAVESSAKFGGLATMGEALGRGMVLTFAIWNDASGYMNWLDAGTNGPCSATEGNPQLIAQENPLTHVIFSNIRWGDIGSTFESGASNGTTTTTSATSAPTSSTSATSTPVTTTSTAPESTQTHYGQCGGIGYTGPSTCASGFTCTSFND